MIRLDVEQGGVEWIKARRGKARRGEAVQGGARQGKATAMKGGTVKYEDHPM